MRIHLGADSTAYRSAEALRDALDAAGYVVVWHAAPAFDENDDYPGITIHAVQAVVADEDKGADARAIILSATGAGEVIAANKVNGGRVLGAISAEHVAAARSSADINGVVIALDHTDDAEVPAIVSALLGTGFSNDLDDARRLVNVAEFETNGTIEGWMVEG